MVVADDIELAARVIGGGQERGLRAGTENVAGVVGFGVAAEICAATLDEFEKIGALRDDMEQRLRQFAPASRVIGDDGTEMPPGEIGRLAVRGPTGCRYLKGENQANYVGKGWNLTGDAYRMDADGYFWFEARNDDMIISAGYNISGPEVEAALLEHAAVAECACVAAPDEARGNIVKAFVVLQSGVAGDGALVETLQTFVKSRIAPYKYPRAIEFVDALPKTGSGKIQRFRLRETAREQAAKS